MLLKRKHCIIVKWTSILKQRSYYVLRLGEKKCFRNHFEQEEETSVFKNHFEHEEETSVFKNYFEHEE